MPDEVKLLETLVDLDGYDVSVTVLLGRLCIRTFDAWTGQLFPGIHMDRGQATQMRDAINKFLEAPCEA